ncbi:MAG: hypothetical protein ABIV47_22520 [Roseiflexaceae bacterium]
MPKQKVHDQGLCKCNFCGAASDVIGAGNHGKFSIGEQVIHLMCFLDRNKRIAVAEQHQDWYNDPREIIRGVIQWRHPHRLDVFQQWILRIGAMGLPKPGRKIGLFALKLLGINVRRSCISEDITHARAILLAELEPGSTDECLGQGGIAHANL